jgi:pimeloyl-ACP methyl ester carboxylesterase
VIKLIISVVRRLSLMAQKDAPAVFPCRDANQETAIVFLHGFGGETRKTWARFVDILLATFSIRTWDVFGVGYPTSLRVDVPNVWAADPDLELLARELRTLFDMPPLARYRRVAIVAHSMGGLVVQRAVLDDASLAGRLSHMFLFGAPSNGLSKARLFSGLKRQLRDMRPDSAFIKSLRADWKRAFSGGTPFTLRVVVGDRDEFVSSTSSLPGFRDQDLRVLPGNHLEIVKPTGADHPGVILVIDTLTGGSRVVPVVDGARLAVERGQFQAAIATLIPRVSELDDAALASLALALEAEGRGDEALEILQRRYDNGRGLSTTDAIGVLAGRLKRRWLTERVAADLTRARELYSEGLARAEAANDHAQGYYHAINIAFLDLMAAPAASDLSADVAAMARRALGHCKQASEGAWRHATEGEVALILRGLDEAERHYSQAVADAESPREIDSMYSQAVRVAERVFGRRGVSRIRTVFGLSSQ